LPKVSSSKAINFRAMSATVLVDANAGEAKSFRPRVGRGHPSSSHPQHERKSRKIEQNFASTGPETPISGQRRGLKRLCRRGSLVFTEGR
jgi:hypothetical protein